MTFFNSPVYPIPPSFLQEELELTSTESYLEFLHNKGAKHAMTTVGTSQFNLLDIKEIRLLNNTVANFKGNSILALPPLSSHHLSAEIEHLNSQHHEDSYLLLLFPDRYYHDQQIVDFVQEACSKSEYPVLLHAMPFRDGRGGTYSYSHSLLQKLSTIENFIGIKEESLTIDFSIKNMHNLDLEILVAGGSMRRFWALSNFGATSFVSGVGSFNPIIEERFFSLFSQGKLQEASTVIENFETPLFSVFMKEGWHKSMRCALKHLGYVQENRKPFASAEGKSTQTIITALQSIL